MKVGGGEIITGFLGGSGVRIVLVARGRMLGHSCCEATLTDKERGASSLIEADDGFKMARMLMGGRCS